MRVTSKHTLRWAVPATAVAAVAVIAGAALAPRAVAEPTLPPKTAEQLLVDLKTQHVDDFAGTVETRSDLGLPPLPNDTQSGLAGLLSGTHTVRVWSSGEDKSRASVVDAGAETSVFRNGQDVWTWSSKERKATHTTLPAKSGPSPTPSATPKTPQQTAQEFLAQIEPSTTVTVANTATVAGRDAYELVLQPKSDATLVDKVAIAVDAQNSAPLRVEVWPNGASQPAVQVGFTQVDFTAPDDAVFRFTPPAGVTVEEKQPKQAGPNEQRPQQTEPTRVGEGWETVTIATLPKPAASPTPAPGASPTPAPDASPTPAPGTEPTPTPGQGGGTADWEQLKNSLPTVSGPWGTGKVLTSSLFTVVFTDDGRVAAGLVPTERVVAAIPQ